MVYLNTHAGSDEERQLCAYTDLLRHLRVGHSEPRTIVKSQIGILGDREFPRRSTVYSSAYGVAP